MAYQVSGQAPAPGSEGRRLKEVERAIAQLQRLMTAKQKIPKVTPGGGIEGITRVSAWELTATATATNVLVAPSGTFDITERAGEAPTVTQSGSGVILAAGYYLVTMDAYITFSGTRPPGGRYWLDYSGSEYHFPQVVVPIIEDVVGGSDNDLVTSWTVGPLPIESPGSLTFGASWPGSNTSAFVNYWSLDIAKVSGA